MWSLKYFSPEYWAKRYWNGGTTPSTATFQEPFTTLYASRSTADLPATNIAAALFTTDCTTILNSCDQPTTLSGPINDN